MDKDVKSELDSLRAEIKLIKRRERQYRLRLSGVQKQVKTSREHIRNLKHETMALRSALAALRSTLSRRQ